MEGKTEKESIEYLHRLITNDLFPDLFFIIDSKKPHSLKEDRLDQKSKVFRNQIRHSYYELAANNVYPTRLIDTTKGKWNNYLNEISQNIVSRVSINEFLDGKIA
jgi:thymidylate kinase